MYLTSHIPQIKKLCEHHQVGKLYAFGSVLTDRFSKDSDVDLIVDIKENDPIDYSEQYFDLKFKLEDLFDRPVDLLEERAIRNPYFRQHLDETKQLIYG
jgi:predicted nucleotidyltransferase